MSDNRRVVINDTTYIEHVQGSDHTVRVWQTPELSYISVQAVDLSKKDLHHILSVLNTQETHIPPLLDGYERMGDAQLLRRCIDLVVKSASSVNYSEPGAIDELKIVEHMILARMAGGPRT